MGNRANIIVKDGREQVCLYTHWGRDGLPEILREALKRGRDRWSDFPYLTRIIFCEMVQGQEMKTTGFGISQTIGDGDSHVITVDVDTQTVQISNRVWTVGGTPTAHTNSKPPISFIDYISGSEGWEA